MPLAATCPHCRTPHRLAEDLDGRLIRCKECGEPFRVGGRRRDEYDDSEYRPRRRSSSSSSLVMLAIIGVVLGVGVMIVGGAAVWYVLSPRNVRPGPRIVGMRNPPITPPVRRSGVIADHTIFPPRPAGVFRPPEVPEGPITVTLVNPRRVEGVMVDRPTYQFDYQIVGDLPKRGSETYHLVAKVPEGVADTFLRFADGQAQGTITFNFVPGHDPAAEFEIWVEREPFGKPAERARVSKPVTFN